MEKLFAKHGHTRHQAVANQLNCVIHIIGSRLSCTEGSTINPSGTDKKPTLLFIGYIEELHYVYTVPHTTNKNALKYLKFKLSKSDEQHQKRIINQQERKGKGNKSKLWGMLRKKPVVRNSTY